ncbi:hypothetical protein DY000_02063972 [Brassica cretica]|uniref:Homeobox domain-containing protein n=1 Tax=Brassica cretica TaxID=69181 RepID=A0ABQ7B2T7_BRACR|nr:hypothetical protein DY000_02063972 [Brassica cretica]
MQPLYQESIYLNEQQQASSSSAASFSGGGGGLDIPNSDGGVRNEMVFIPPTNDVVVTGLNESSSNDLSLQGGGLSLSLGNQIQYHYQNLSNQLNYSNDENGKSLSHHHHQHQAEQVPSTGYSNGVGYYNNYRYETSGFVSSVLRSRYLKPTQQLLDEVVSVRKDMKLGDSNKKTKNNNNYKAQDFTNGSSDNNTENEKLHEELSPQERQELQSKKNKLLTMADEVDKRYNQYYHQMEALASSFEMVAGLGAAKPYTSVALNRISRHFRCLRDAIKEQIQVIRGKLGEKETSEEQGERIPRLRYLDQRLRQQRALHQQLGMNEKLHEELSPQERQELQSKKNKLLTMADEVDKRYNQYYHQMEALASSFEMVAGLGAAKPYTSVALNRISRHFRCLRDAIKEQIQVIRGKLGEKETSEEQGERIPRLRYLDQRLRQQRALHQQLGMVRPSWRPQRGLPENSVSILRAWLFEHFLHPYPKESEKIMLAKQTGLSKNQVANWFINARVRLWKPMIEEMYKEEFGDASELLSNSNRDKNKMQETSQLKHEDSSSSQQHHQGNNNNNNIAYTSAVEENLVFTDPKPDRVTTTGDYDSLMNYHQGFGVDDYNRYIGLGNQQDGRFSNPHQLHDFVV